MDDPPAGGSWFVGLSMDAPVGDAPTFSKNRDRLLAGDVAHGSLAAAVARPRVKAPMSDGHFPVDGTLTQALRRPCRRLLCGWIERLALDGPATSRFGRGTGMGNHLSRRRAGPVMPKPTGGAEAEQRGPCQHGLCQDPPSRPRPRRLDLRPHRCRLQPRSTARPVALGRSRPPVHPAAASRRALQPQSRAANTEIRRRSLLRQAASLPTRPAVPGRMSAGGGGPAAAGARGSPAPAPPGSRR